MQGYLDVKGVARRLGVKPATVYIYKYRAQRRRLAEDYDPKTELLMPKPVDKAGNSPIWDETEIDEWDALRIKRGLVDPENRSTS